MGVPHRQPVLKYHKGKGIPWVIFKKAIMSTHGITRQGEKEELKDGILPAWPAFTLYEASVKRLQGSQGNACCGDREVKSLSKAAQPEEGKKCIRQPSKGRSSTNRVLKVAIKYNEIPEGVEKELTTMTRGQSLKSTLSNELVTLEKIVAQLPHAFARNCIPIFRTVAHLQ